MLINVVEVFNGTLSQVQGALEAPTGNIYYTGPEFYDALGRGEKLVPQLIVDSSPTPSAGGVTVTARAEQSNDGKTWEAIMGGELAVIIPGEGFSVPRNTFHSGLGAMQTLGAKIRFRIVSSIEGATARLLVAVRGEGGR